MVNSSLSLVLVGTALVLTGLLYNTEAANKRALCIQPRTTRYMTCEAGSYIFPVRAVTFRSHDLSSAAACCSSWELRGDCATREAVTVDEYHNTDLVLRSFFGECRLAGDCEPRAPISAGYLHQGVEYICISAKNNVRFEDRAYRSTNALVQWHHASRSAGVQYWHCLVETSDCSPGLADVFLAKISNGSDLGSCTGLKVKDKAWLECGGLLQQQTYRSITTPFPVVLRVDQNDNDSLIWAVVYAQDDQLLYISCGQEGETSSSKCSGSRALPGIVCSVLLAMVIVVIIVVAVLRFKFKSALAASTPQPGADNSTYSALSLRTMFQPRKLPGHDALGCKNDVTSSGDNSGYTDPYSLTRAGSKTEPLYVSIIE